MKITKPISIRPQLLGEVVEFLKQEMMECLVTQEGVVELVSQLVYYREEGKALYPEIFIFDDLETIKKVLPASQFCLIGKGEKRKETILKALKKCAPLTEDGWAIYILRNPDSFEYGVFRAGTSLLSVSIPDTLIEGGTELLKVILIHQVAEKIIEVKGVTADSLIISFGTQEDLKKSPTEYQFKFIENLILNVDDELKEQARTFYKKLFLEILQIGHGTLACIVSSSRKDPPKKLSDGIILNKKLDITQAIKEVLINDDLQANANLEGLYSLVLGMMQSDGITVFMDDGSVLGYNVFVKHTDELLKSTNGGARSRTFLTLCEMIGKGITSAYIQSQDGKIDYK